MLASLPEATEVNTPIEEEDISTSVGTVTREIHSNVDNNQLIQEALPTSLADGIRYRITRYNPNYSRKVVDKCIILAAFNNCIICSFGYIYSFVAIFYIGVYFHVIITFGLQPQSDTPIERNNCDKKCDLFFVAISYISRTTWIGIRILYGKSDFILIILGLLTFFHDLELIYLISESINPS